MAELFLDTGFAIALAPRHDQHHDRFLIKPLRHFRLAREPCHAASAHELTRPAGAGE